jgi:hypothetical protein
MHLSKEQKTVLEELIKSAPHVIVLDGYDREPHSRHAVVALTQSAKDKYKSVNQKEFYSLTNVSALAGRKFQDYSFVVIDADIARACMFDYFNIK